MFSSKCRSYVGSASFRCDLAILADDERSYALGILLDGRADEAIEDRYIFQPAILRAFGWKVIDVPSHSWLRDPKAVISQIEAALRSDAFTDDDPFDGAPTPKLIAQPSIEEPSPSLEENDSGSGSGFAEFQFQQGSSDKFWKIAVTGCDTIVIFGRSGTKGSTVTKTFKSPERAQREASKLIAEKVRKGYVEI